MTHGAHSLMRVEASSASVAEPVVARVREASFRLVGNERSHGDRSGGDRPIGRDILEAIDPGEAGRREGGGALSEIAYLPIRQGDPGGQPDLDAERDRGPGRLRRDGAGGSTTEPFENPGPQNREPDLDRQVGMGYVKCEVGHPVAVDLAQQDQRYFACSNQREPPGSIDDLGLGNRHGREVDGIEYRLARTLVGDGSVADQFRHGHAIGRGVRGDEPGRSIDLRKLSAVDDQDVRRPGPARGKTVDRIDEGRQERRTLTQDRHVSIRSPSHDEIRSVVHRQGVAGIDEMNGHHVTGPGVDRGSRPGAVQAGHFQLDDACAESVDRNLSPHRSQVPGEIGHLQERPGSPLGRRLQGPCRDCQVGPEVVEADELSPNDRLLGQGDISPVREDQNVGGSIRRCQASCQAQRP